MKKPEFTMEAGDRSYTVLVSDSIRYESALDAETVLTFFVIRRASGKFDVFHVLKTFERGKCVSRQVQDKRDIQVDAVDREVEAIRAAFTLTVEAGSAKRLTWHTLDLSGVTDGAEQVRRIRDWGRVGVSITASWN